MKFRRKGCWNSFIWRHLTVRWLLQIDLNEKEHVDLVYVDFEKVIPSVQIYTRILVILMRPFSISHLPNNPLSHRLQAMFIRLFPRGERDQVPSRDG